MSRVTGIGLSAHTTWVRDILSLADAPGHKQPLHFWRSAELDSHLQDIESIGSLDLAIFVDSYRKQ